MNEQLLKKVGKFVPNEVLEDLLKEWNPIILVDRTILPTYPNFMKDVLYPCLELTGPLEFDVRKLQQCCHPRQTSGFIFGDKILDYLIAEKLLDSCLNLADILAFQARGIGFFRKYFLEKLIFAWKSVFLGRGGRLGIPYLYADSVNVYLGWSWLNLVFSRSSILRLAS